MPLSSVPFLEDRLPKLRRAVDEALERRVEFGFDPIEEPHIALDIVPSDPEALATTTRGSPVEIRLAYLYLLDTGHHPEAQEARRTVHKTALLSAFFLSDRVERQHVNVDLLFDHARSMDELETSIAGTREEARYIRDLARTGETPATVRSDLQQRITKHLPIIESALHEDLLDYEVELPPLLVHEFDHADYLTQSPLAYLLDETDPNEPIDLRERIRTAIVTEGRAILSERAIDGRRAHVRDVLPSFIERHVHSMVRGEVSGMFRADPAYAFDDEPLRPERYPQIIGEFTGFATDVLTAISYALDADPSRLSHAGRAASHEEFIDRCYG